MDNLHEGPEWNSTGKVKKNEGSLAELAAILEIENHPEKQLRELQKSVIEHNRKKADLSLIELETVLHLSEVTTDKNDREWIKNPKQTNYDPIHTLTPTIYPSKEISPITNTIPIWIRWVTQGTKESALMIGKSTTKLLTDIMLLPYDVYNYFKKGSKKIG